MALIRPISAHRAINFLHERAAGAALAACVLLVLSASTTPFDFAWRQFPAQPMAAWHRALAARPSLPDILANVLGYMPLGAVAWVALRGRGVSAGRTMIVVPVGALALSCACEWLQCALPLRVCSASDVAANGVGCLLGMACGPLVRGPGRAAVARMQEELRERPLTLAGKMLAVAMMLALLWPLDFALTSKGLVRSARNAHFHPRHEWWSLGEAERHAANEMAAWAARRAQMDYLLDQCAAAAAYALLAALTAAAMRREYGFRRGSAAWLAGWMCLFVAALVVAGRTFMASRGLDTLHLCTATAGAAVGVGVVCLRGWDDPAAAAISLSHLVGGPASRRSETGETPVPQCSFGMGAKSRWTSVVLGLLCAYLLAVELTPFHFGGPRAALGWIPLAGHLPGPSNLAVRDLSGKWLTYAVLGALVAWRMNAGARLGRVVCGMVPVTAAFAAVMQIIHLWMPARHGDVTNVIVAALGTACGIVGQCWASDYVRRVRGGVDVNAGLDWDRALIEAIVTAGPMPESGQSRGTHDPAASTDESR